MTGSLTAIKVGYNSFTHPRRCCVVLLAALGTKSNLTEGFRATMWERGVTLASEGADLLLTVADKGAVCRPTLAMQTNRTHQLMAAQFDGNVKRHPSEKDAAPTPG
jgi:hypothetical protein